MAHILGMPVEDGPVGSFTVTMAMSKRHNLRVVEVQREIEKHLKRMGGTFVLNSTVVSDGIRYSWHPVEEDKDGVVVDASPDSVPEVKDAGNPAAFSKTAARDDEDAYAYLDRRYNELLEENQAAFTPWDSEEAHG